MKWQFRSQLMKKKMCLFFYSTLSLSLSLTHTHTHTHTHSLSLRYMNLLKLSRIFKKCSVFLKKKKKLLKGQAPIIRHYYP